MEIRNATPDDVEAVVALVESAYRGDTSRVGWTTEADLLDGQRTDVDEVRDSLPHLLVAVDGDSLLGCCTVILRAGHAYFGMFAVRPERQARGTGSALLAEAERRARDGAAAYLEMTVLAARRELIAFYVRRGYAATGEIRPFPYGDVRFGKPRQDDLAFVVLAKHLT